MRGAGEPRRRADHQHDEHDPGERPQIDPARRDRRGVATCVGAFRGRRRGCRRCGRRGGRRGDVVAARARRIGRAREPRRRAEALRRLEGDPADALEIDLGPRVQLSGRHLGDALPDDGVARELAGEEPHDDPRWHAERPRHQRERPREVHAVPLFAVEEGGDRLDPGPVEALDDGRVEGVGELGPAEPALQRDEPVVVGLRTGGHGARSVADHRRRIGGHRGHIDRGVVEARRRGADLFEGRLRRLRDDLVSLPLRVALTGQQCAAVWHRAPVALEARDRDGGVGHGQVGRRELGDVDVRVVLGDTDAVARRHRIEPRVGQLDRARAVGLPDVAVEQRQGCHAQVRQLRGVAAEREHGHVAGLAQFVAEVERGVDARGDPRAAGRRGRRWEGRPADHRTDDRDHADRHGHGRDPARPRGRRFARAGLGADEVQDRRGEHDERDHVDPGGHGDGGDEPDDHERHGRQQGHPCREHDVVERDREQAQRRDDHEPERGGRGERRDPFEDLLPRVAHEIGALSHGLAGRDDPQQRGARQEDRRDRRHPHDDLDEGHRDRRHAAGAA